VAPDSKITTAAELVDYLTRRNLDHVKVGVFDVDGVMRGKYLGRDKLISALDHGMGFCNVVLGWDCDDRLYDNVAYTGWRTAYPDAPVRLLPHTTRLMPDEGDMPLVLGEFAGSAEAVCPRGALRRVLDRADSMGFTVKAAAEFEFFLFEETPRSVREKNYQNLRAFTPGNFGYSMLRSGVHGEFYRDLLSFCERMDMGVEGLHTETGPGVLEAALRVDEALAAADKAALFKTMAKVFFQRRGLMATFMARWSADLPGLSGHLHTSLVGRADGRSVFFAEDQPLNMSREMRWYVGGQQRLMPQLLAMIACTVNSYTRLVPGFWAPTSATWGFENRTCALRVIGGSPASQLVEHRIAAADINPHIALAAAIGSGLWGIERQIEPEAPIVGNAYDHDAGPALALPSTLWEAAQALRASAAAADLFGAAFVDHYASTREWEERQARMAVTDWQLARYFEII
jgi:glutamine synthetase